MSVLPAEDSPAGLQRDRLSWALYLSLGTCGFFLYAFGVSVPLLRDELGVSRSAAGLHGTAMAGGSIVAGLFGAWLIARLGRTLVLALASLVMCVGVLIYCGGHVVGLTLLGALLGGTGASLTINLVNALMMDLHGTSGPAALSEANAFGGGAGILAPLVVGGAVALGLGWRTGLLVTVALVVVLRVVFRPWRLPPPLPLPAGTPGVTGDGDAVTVRLPPAFWITWLVVACVIGVEFCLALWVGDELHHRDGMTAGAATAGVASVLAGMTVSRVAGGRLGLRHGIDWLLYRSIAVLLVGFAGFWLTTSVWLALPALAACGIGLGMLAPLSIARSVVAASGRSDLALARTSLAAGLAIGAGPFLIGAIADRTSVHAAFLLVPTLLVVAVVALATSRPMLAELGGGREWVDGQAGG